MNFLYDDIKSEFGRELRKDKSYSFVNANLNPKLKLREYQTEAFKRFYLYYENDDVEEYVKPTNNIHLCFNMATGSGKTVIMSGLILYLYNEGYRNFLFFVNRGQIVEKTKDNFINSTSSKYLFNDKIVIDNKEVKIKAVDNFSYSSSDDINICFTTIQGLFSDIHNEKENSLTLEDFKDKKIALIADEAHHINASTKKKGKQLDIFSEVEESATWENTVESIFQQHAKNILLEFTATLELENKSVKEKYLNKIIYKYDLKDFVKDGYSKKIDLLKSDTSKDQRILQALLTSLYREKIAIKYNLNIKPVILFKSSKIAESTENQEAFHKQIENLKAKDLEKIKKTTDIEILQLIFQYFDTNSISLNAVVEDIKLAFQPNKCLCTNNDKELEENQRLLNSLEDSNNSIRAIFTVDKLNEGWDVLNLYDIVRLYEGQSTGGSDKGKIGKKTISEAQLVGRGARYCPFKIKETDDQFVRKYDSDITNELRILEELYFHSENESRYIYEIKRALVEQGLIEEDEKAPIEFKVKLKKEHRNTDFLNNIIFLNRREKKNYNYVKDLKDFGIAKSNYLYELQSGKGSLVDVFDDKDELKESRKETESFNLVEFMGINLISNTLLFNDFYEFNNLTIYLPNLKSIKQFIEDEQYLKQFNVDIKGDGKSLENITIEDKLDITLEFLTVLENEMKNNIIEFEGTDFEAQKFKDYFEKDKVLLVPKEKEKKIMPVSDDWFVFEEFYGTSEEDNLIELIRKMINDIQKKYDKDNLYLVRNERHFKIYNFDDGRAFEPDFVLFTKNKTNNLNFQIFIEPKGDHLKLKDMWKEDFLQEIKARAKGKVIEFESNEYKVIGLQFYEKANENPFKDELKIELGI